MAVLLSDLLEGSVTKELCVAGTQPGAISGDSPSSLVTRFWPRRGVLSRERHLVSGCHSGVVYLDGSDLSHFLGTSLRCSWRAALNGGHRGS